MTSAPIPYCRVGLGGCDRGVCAVLPRSIGRGRAAELHFAGRVLGGEDAERWGFFNRFAAPAKRKRVFAGN